LSGLEFSYFHLLQAETKAASKKFLDAYLHSVEAIKANPKDIHIQNEFSKYKNSLYEHFITLAWSNPQDPELGTLFEILETLSYQSIESLCLGALFYQLVGQIEKSQAIKNRVTDIFPNAYFLKTDSEILLRDHHGPQLKYKKEFLLEEFKTIYDKYNQIRFHINNQGMDKALAIIEPLIAHQKINDINRELFYAKAVCFDMTANHIDALVIMAELKDKYPFHIHYLKSFNLILDNIRVAAQELVEVSPDDKLIVSYFEILSEYDHCNLDIAQKAAFIYLKTGEVNKAQNIMSMTLKLMPNNPFYLKEGLKFYKQIDQTMEVQKIEAHLKLLQETFSYDIGYN
jgi:tetratricopeptide (TPR) repeat protein